MRQVESRLTFCLSSVSALTHDADLYDFPPAPLPHLQAVKDKRVDPDKPRKLSIVFK